MATLRYSLIIPLFALFHLLLTGWALPVAWCCCGIFLAIVKIGPAYLIAPSVLLAEVITGLGFRALAWNTSGQLSALSENSQASSFTWVSLIIGINTLTSILCVVSSFYVTRLFARKPLYHFSL